MAPPDFADTDQCPDDTEPQIPGQQTKRTISATEDGLFVPPDGCQEHIEPSREAVKRMRYSIPAAPSECCYNKDELAQKGCHPVHEAHQKGLPKLGPYHPSFKLAEAVITEACDIFFNAYQKEKEDGYYNEEVENICTELEYCRIPSNFYPPVRPAAVLGPAGCGKSSALNSLMDQSKVAFSHDGQDRGTYAVHEFRYAQSKQTSRFLIEVPFLSKEEVIKAAKKHFRSIRLHLLTTEESEDEIEADERPSVESFDTAITFFCDILADRVEFRTKEDTEDFFKDMDLESEERLKERVLKYMDEAYTARAAMVDGKEIYNCDTEDDLDAATRAVARPAKQQNPGRRTCPWPIIRKVIIHQKLDLLMGGTVLADLPGANDSNEIVAANTRSYLKQAGTILIFFPYKRVLGDPLLRGYLRTCVQLGRTRETRLVLTMIDEMQLFDSSARAELITSDQGLLRRAEDSVDELQHRIEETSQAKDLAEGSEYKELDLKLRAFEQQLKKAEAGIKQTTIQIRCEEIRSGLKDSFRNLTGSKNEPDLPVHFISNVMYQQFVSNYKKNIPDWLAEQTGIPQLRHEILKIPTSGKLDKAYGLSRIRLPNLFSGVNGVLTKTILERKAEVKSILVQNWNIVRQPVEGALSEIQAAFEDGITAAVKGNDREWKARGEDVLAKYEKINAGTMLALFKRKGDWVHRKLGTLNCNLDIQQVFSPELSEAFNGFEDRLGGIQMDTKRNIFDATDNLKTAIGECPAAAGQRLGPFMKHIDQVSKKALLQIDEAFSRLNTKNIRNCSILDTEDSYVRRVLCAVYQQCILINSNNYQTFTRGANSTDTTKQPARGGRGKGRGKGTGRRRATNGASVHKARIQNMRNKLRGESSETSLFQDVTTFGYQDLTREVDGFTDEVHQIVDEYRQEILQDFERRFRGPDVKPEERPDSVQRLQEAALVSERMITEEIIPLLKECFSHEDKVVPY